MKDVAGRPSLNSGLWVKRVGIDTYREPVVYMHSGCHICRAEGFQAQARVKLSLKSKTVIATLNVVRSDFIAESEAGLSEVAWRELEAFDGDVVQVSHVDALESFSAVRAKVYRHELSVPQIDAIVRDVAACRYSALELAAFVTACADTRLSLQETVELTRAMVNVGERLQWGTGPVVDKHCVGGLPGNRTTPIVVAIAAANGLLIPKTSSRAITSPSGTADTMEMLAPVDLSLAQMRRVVDAEGGCVVWGGAMALSPADDILIQVERPLDLDSEGQLVASVLSKKIAAGSTHVVLDLPVGPTAKVRTARAAQLLGARLRDTATALGLQVRIVESDGTQPVGRGIGPALEARDVLAVLRNDAEAPDDLRQRALALAAQVLELGGRCVPGAGADLASHTLASGAALRKFEAICRAQGGLREPPAAPLQRVFVAERAGTVRAIDNRRLARIAKLAGAPTAPAAGLTLHVHGGEYVAKGQPLFTLQAEAPGELDYAAGFAKAHPETFLIETVQ